MIQVINRAFDIIELIAADPEIPKSLSTISGKLGLNAGTCANIIKTMIDRKYLEKTENQKGYRLGPMLYSVAGTEAYQQHLVDAAKDELESLTKKLNENSLLTILQGEKRVAILRVNSDHGIQATTSREKNALETTSGRLLVAMLADDAIKKFIAKYGLPASDVWPGAHTVKGFDNQIKKIRHDQFTVQNIPREMMGLAVPVFASGKVIASLGVYMPLYRFKPGQQEKMLALMKVSAGKISKSM